MSSKKGSEKKPSKEYARTKTRKSNPPESPRPLRIEQMRADALKPLPYDATPILAEEKVAFLKRFPKLRDYLFADQRLMEGDPFHIMAAFCSSQESGEFAGTPASTQTVVRRIAGWYRTWFESSGTKSMDRIMGLRRPGTQNAFKRADTYYRDQDLFSSMTILRSLGVNISIDAAARMVCARLEVEEPDLLPKYKLTAEGLALRYKRSFHSSSEALELQGSLMMQMTPTDRSQCLKGFPWSSLPPHIQKLLSD